MINNSQKIFRYLYVDLHDYHETIFLAGSPRSGTTWLQEIINYKNEYRVIFEPFYPQKVKKIDKWRPIQYLNENENSPMYLEPMTDILSGRIRNSWVDKYNKLFLVDKRIIKAVRANLILFWIKKHFPEVPIILLLRHPCAVANSKINIIKNWFPESYNPLNRIFVQDKLMEDFLRPYEEKLRDAKTIFEQCIFMWCIETIIPIKLFHEDEIHITFYENLCTNAINEIKNVFSFIDKPFLLDFLKAVPVPSSKSVQNSAINLGTDLIKTWRENITHNQLHKAIEILCLFGLDKIYNDNDYPLLSSREILKEYGQN